MLVGPFPPTKGGVTTFMLNLMASPLREKYDFVPFTTSRPPKKNVSDNYGYAAMFRGGIGRLIIGALVTLWHLILFPWSIMRQRIDVVQIQSSDFQTFWESCLYSWMSRRLGKPVFMRLGGAFNIFYESSSDRAKRLIVKGVMAPDRLIVQSEYWRDYLAGLGRTDGVIVLSNSVPESMLVAAESVRNDPPVCLFVIGNESVRKGAETFIQALKSETVKSANVQFHCIAVPPDVDGKLSAMGYGSRLRTEGFIDHDALIQAMRSADFFLLPSFGEGFPNSLLEAMAAGLAPVVTPVGAVPEIVTDGENAIVMSPGDADQLAGAITRLAADQEIRFQMAQKAQERLQQAYLAHVVLERLARGYEEMKGALQA